MKKLIRGFVPIGVLLAVLYLCYSSHAQMSDKEFTFISTKDLAKGIQDKRLTVLDANTPEVYETGHIPTAFHINYASPKLTELPNDQSTPLVFYCKNPRCMASHQAARFAKDHGYTNVRVYPLGIDGWKAAGMAVESKESMGSSLPMIF